MKETIGTGDGRRLPIAKSHINVLGGTVNTEKKIPVVIGESNFLTGRLLIASLQVAGHPAVVGRDGDDVMKLLDQYRPEVLILNMNLGRPSGLELLRMLHQRNGALKILATSAPGQAELRAAAASLGVSAFFEIPFLPEEIRESVRMLVG